MVCDQIAIAACDRSAFLVPYTKLAMGEQGILKGTKTTEVTAADCSVSFQSSVRALLILIML